MSDGHTIDVGHVHVLTAHGGPCRDDCPHPDHKFCTCRPYWPADDPRHVCTCGAHEHWD